MNRLIYLTIHFLLFIPTNYAQVSPAIKITAAVRNPGDYFGNSVGTDGSYAVVGACFPGGSQSGKAIVFERDAGGNWNQTQVLIPSDLQTGRSLLSENHCRKVISG